jgi:predicted nucleic acid-binding protein
LILVDTSIWVDHLRKGDAHLAGLLERAAVLSHPFVIGELACGSLANRGQVLQLLQNLPTAVMAEPEEVLGYIERRRLFAQGIGYVDAQLLASTALTEGALLWTRDKRLLAVAHRLGCAYVPGSTG